MQSQMVGRAVTVKTGHSETVLAVIDHYEPVRRVRLLQHAFNTFFGELIFIANRENYV